jgi:aminoglycoside phosphotransferase (APT) family kinase protein
MAIVDSGDADLSVLGERLQTWVRGQAGGREARISGLRSASDANGFSNATYRFTLAAPGGRDEELILRLPPARAGLFPDYDMARQYAFMQRLQGEPGLAMARCRWLEQDPAALGRPFYVAEFVAGETASDQPKYLCEGWIVDADAAQRRRLWDSSVEQLIRLARIRWHGERLASLDWADRQSPRLSQHLAMWAHMGAWGAQQLPPAADPFVDELAAWLHAQRPREERPGVVWGDSRFGNILYRDFQPAALLDWELAVIGDPMTDLAYMLFHVFLTELYHGEAGAPSARLSGFRGDAQTVAIYCEATQRSAQDYRYYWLFNAYKMLCIWQCKAALMVRSGVWSREQALRERRGERLRPWISQVLESGPESAYLR